MRPRRRSKTVYRRAIVPLDGSPFAQAVLPFFRHIAGPLDIEVILVRVVAPQAMAPIEEPGVRIRELATRRVDAEEYLSRLAGDLRNRGVRVDTRVSRGEERRRSVDPHAVTARTHREEDVMLVRALMTGAPITLPPDTSIFEARRLMDGERIRHVLVTLGGDLLGIVTDRDIRLNMPSQATSLSVWELNYLLAKVTVGEVMTRSVITIGPDLDAHDAAQIMVDRRIGALPVIDDGRLVGIVTETDLLRAFVRVGAESRTLRGR